MKKLRSVFIGGSPISAVGRAHVSAIRLDNKYELRGGVFSSVKKRNEQAYEAYGINKDNIISNIDEIILLKKDIDLVHVLTPPDSHHSDIKKLLSHGIPVLSEKPLVTSVEAAKDIVSAVREHNAFLPVMYNYLGYPMIRELRKKMSQGWLGKVHEIRVSMPQEGFMKTGESGSSPSPQKWRQIDYSLPTVSLDLGVHCHMLVGFLTNLAPTGVYASTSNAGRVSGVLDSVNALVNYEDDVLVSYWFGKSYLGFRNGLAIDVFGDMGSVRWVQTDSEILQFCDVHGERRIIDRGSLDIEIANSPVYERFKVGHPGGFIEAMSNYYSDIHESMLNKKFNANVFGAEESLEGLKLLDAMKYSSIRREWISCA
jgi:predicted dehydrogenase